MSHYAIQDAITRTSISKRMGITAPTFRSYFGATGFKALVEIITAKLFFQSGDAQPSKRRSI